LALSSNNGRDLDRFRSAGALNVLLPHPFERRACPP
jgi:hypothetical protein